METTITIQTKQSLKEAKAEVHKAAKKAWEDFKIKNPHLSGFEIKANTYCYKKRPSGFHKVIKEIMSVIAVPKSRHPQYAHIPAGADRTQTEIIESIRAKFPAHKILPNVWNKPLTKKQLEKLQDTLSRNFQQNIDIKGSTTLAQVKKRIQATIHRTDAIHRFKGSITIGEEAVVVGKDIYPVETKKSGNYEYPSIRVNLGQRRAWLRVDLLQAVLPCNLIIAKNKTGEEVLST